MPADSARAPPIRAIRSRVPSPADLERAPSWIRKGLGMNRFISLGEVRLGLRLIVKQPVLSATVVLALATGICLTTMGFTFRDELLNSKLPYQAGERMARLFAFNRDGQRLDIDLERYHAFRDRAETFAHVGAVTGRPFTITHRPGDVETVTGAMLTPRSMRWLDASPLAGRLLIDADGESGAEPVALIRESSWHRRYSANPNIVGRAISIGAQSRTIVGIMPNSFAFPNSGELWLPLDEPTLGGIDGVRVFGVLKPGVTFESATTEIELLSARLPLKAPPEDIARMQVLPFTADSGQAGVAVTALVFVLVMVLLVVASNVATLVYARTWSRAPELAVRTAIGAARSRVVGQLFAETLVLGSIAAVIGMAGAYAAPAVHQGLIRGLAVLDHARSESPCARLCRGSDAAGQRRQRPDSGATRDSSRSSLDTAGRARLRVWRVRPRRGRAARRRGRAVGGAAERGGDDGAGVRVVHR